MHIFSPMAKPADWRNRNPDVQVGAPAAAAVVIDGKADAGNEPLQLESTDITVSLAADACHTVKE
jgi:hypothetical protein